MLGSVFRHRFLSARHVPALHFRLSGARVCQVRLQRLWAGQYLDRLYLPSEVPGQRDPYSGRPLYCLGPLGADIVADDQHARAAEIPHTPSQNRQGFATLRHHLAFTDFAVAWEATAAAGPELRVTVTHERTMRAAVHEARKRRKLSRVLVPDGAVSVTTPTAPQPQTIVVEIVRAGVKTGNAAIAHRFNQYRTALRSGLLRELYGFAWVRHVVFLTPTWQRARNLAALARDIPGAERLFRFGTFDAGATGQPTTACFPGKTSNPFPVLTPQGRTGSLLAELSIT